MPRKPARPCTTPGCPNLVTAGSKCAKHERERKHAVDARRASPDRGFYGTKAWRRLRAIVLREEPVCPCGRMTDTVDHIVERRVRPDLALTRSNLRALCKSCHDRRTASESGGFGNATR